MRDYYVRLGQMVCANFGRLPFSKLDADMDEDRAGCRAEQQNTGSNTTRVYSHYDDPCSRAPQLTLASLKSSTEELTSNTSTRRYLIIEPVG